MQALLNARRNQARAGGAMTNRRGTHALMTKVRQAERALERVEQVDKPYEPWELHLRLGPIDLDLAPGERVAVTGRNGSGKTTLLALLLGELPLSAGTRALGRATVVGTLDQRRHAYDGEEALIAAFTARSGLLLEDARTLLAKFNLGADHVGRPCATLSPGERTRAQLAELMARGVNLLVLDEPTNHLDLEAIEELETALQAYDGTLVVVSHDRRFLEAVAPTRSIDL